MDVYPYFASPIYREERPEWVEETLKHTQKYYEQTKEWSPDNAVVKQTGHMANDPDLGYLASYFRDKGVSILKDQGYFTDEHDFYLSGMWGQGGSYPIFDDPRPGKKMSDLPSAPSDQVTMATPYIHFNNVIPGTMMFFNSWLPHMITASNSEQPTKFVHFILSCNRRFV